jgi:hypothetical protein
LQTRRDFPEWAMRLASVGRLACAAHVVGGFFEDALPVVLAGKFAVERAIEHRVGTDAGDDAPHEPQREVKRVGGGS